MTDPDEELLADLLLSWEELRERGQETPASELAKDHPRLADELARRIALLKKSSWLDEPLADDPFDGDTQTAAPRQPKTLADRYRLDELIAEGGFAHVFRAYDTELQRTVAVKMPKPGRLTSKESFQAEARRVARLKHDNIVPVYDVGLEGDTCFIVTEYAEGGSLADRIVRGKPARQDALRWIVEIADALEYAHLHGVIHRDIKPANILIGANGRAKLADFGIAQSATKTTSFAPTLGTLRYMSPEQLEGRPADHRSDIYSLGVVLYESLTGSLPYSSSEPNVLRKEIILGHKDSWAEGIPTELRPAVNTALSRSPHQRQASAAQFAAEIRRAHDAKAPRAAARWLAGLLTAVAAIACVPAIHGWRTAASRPVPQPPGQLLVSGIGKQTILEGKVPSAWIRDGVFAEIAGSGVAKFPRLPVSTFVLEVDMEMRNPRGRISFFTGEPGAGVDLPLGGLWPQDAQQDKVPCRLFRSQPWGVNWLGEAHLTPNRRMTLKLVVNDDFKALVRNRGVVLGSTGDASDFCLTLTATEETDATIYRAVCRALTPEDAEEANQQFTTHALECDVTATRRRLGSQIDASWKRRPLGGEPFVIDELEMPLRWIEPGEFTMGTAAERLPQLGAGRERVRISNGYWIGAYEVTQGQWQRVMASNPSRITGSPYLPVNNISWSEACDFCARLTERERRSGRCPAGLEYRLPTEAEWEFACRAGSDEAVVIPKAEIAMRGNRHRSIVEVGTTPPNGWGLHEVLGNVPEWCLDAWRDYSGDESTVVIDRYHPADSATTPFVVRGNGFWITEMGTTSFSRTRRHDIRGGFRGFRIVFATPARDLAKGSEPSGP